MQKDPDYECQMLMDFILKMVQQNLFVLKCLLRDLGFGLYDYNVMTVIFSIFYTSDAMNTLSKGVICEIERFEYFFFH